MCQGGRGAMFIFLLHGSPITRLLRDARSPTPSEGMDMFSAADNPPRTNNMDTPTAAVDGMNASPNASPRAARVDDTGSPTAAIHDNGVPHDANDVKTLVERPHAVKREERRRSFPVIELSLVIFSGVGRWCDDAPTWDDAVFVSTAANDEDGVPPHAGDVEIKFGRAYAVDGWERRRSLSPMLFYGVRRRCDDAPTWDDAVGTLTATNDEHGVPLHA